MSVSVCPECLSHGVPLKCVYLETPGEQIPSHSPTPSVTVVLEFSLSPASTSPPAVYRPVVDPRRSLSPEPDSSPEESSPVPRHPVF